MRRGFTGKGTRTGGLAGGSRRSKEGLWREAAPAGPAVSSWVVGGFEALPWPLPLLLALLPLGAGPSAGSCVSQAGERTGLGVKYELGAGSLCRPQASRWGVPGIPWRAL